jgi:8-oxo-dGTP pyrophosphatase MutT (NUDIX family)
MDAARGAGSSSASIRWNAVVREVREETGLVVRPTALAGIDSVRIEREDRSFHSIGIIYHTKLISGSL